MAESYGNKIGTNNVRVDHSRIPNHYRFQGWYDKYKGSSGIIRSGSLVH